MTTKESEDNAEEACAKKRAVHIPWYAFELSLGRPLRAAAQHNKKQQKLLEISQAIEMRMPWTFIGSLFRSQNANFFLSQISM